MALAFVIIGVLLVLSAIRNTTAQLGTQLVSDFTGTGGFLYWIMALLIIGFVGYIPGFRSPGRALLALIVIVFFVKNGTGFFANLQSTLARPPTAIAGAKVQTPTSGIPISLTGSSSGGTSGGSLSAIFGAGSDFVAHL